MGIRPIARDSDLDHISDMGLKSLLLTLTLLVLAAVLLLPRARRFLAIDECLDLGGAWNRARDACEGLPAK